MHHGESYHEAYQNLQKSRLQAMPWWHAMIHMGTSVGMSMKTLEGLDQPPPIGLDV